ncbi:TPA: hypothetical protein ACPDRM_002149 [Pasteurella multocida]
MKRFLLFGLSALVFAHQAFAKDVVFRPSEQDILEKVHLMDKTYEHPEKIKKGVTLFVSSFHNVKKVWNTPVVYGKIEHIKAKTINGAQCDAFTNDPTGKSGWKCLDVLLKAPQTNQDRLYLTRFDDPAFNNGKLLTPVENKKQEIAEPKTSEAPLCDDKRLDEQFTKLLMDVDKVKFIDSVNEEEIAFDKTKNVRVCTAEIQAEKNIKYHFVYTLESSNKKPNGYLITILK